ncbi:hypothetical protein BD769DRAFT_1668098 [Suillus cothurnatus]|nr:hypothetical protein BD769DRAFT_1668098 [Suillus cothurnatus]
MSLIRGRGGKCPCPVCLVPLTELHDLSKTYPLRSVEESERSASHLRAQITNFPRWRNLNHFKSVINISFTDGNKFQDLSKQTLYAGLNILTPRASPEGYQLLRVISSYLQLDSWIGLDVHTESTLAEIEAELLVFDTELKAYVTCAETSAIEDLKLDWDFPKTHLWKHIVRDIRRKGAAHTYHRRTNGKDVATQILRVDHHQFASKLLRERISALDEHHRIQMLGDNPPDEDIPIVFNGHVKLGSPTQHPSLIIDIEKRNASDRAFQAFRRKTF